MVKNGISGCVWGNKSKKNAIGAFNKLGYKKWNFIGKMGVFCGILILSFYTIVAGWVLGYVIEMLGGNFSISNNFGKRSIRKIFLNHILYTSNYFRAAPVPPLALEWPYDFDPVMSLVYCVASVVTFRRFEASRRAHNSSVFWTSPKFV